MCKMHGVKTNVCCKKNNSDSQICFVSDYLNNILNSNVLCYFNFGTVMGCKGLPKLITEDNGSIILNLDCSDVLIFEC